MAEQNGEEKELLTIREIADALGVSHSQAKYAVDQSRIEPRQRGGIIRLFARDQVPDIRLALARTASNRRGRREDDDDRTFVNRTFGQTL